jgi:glyoxylase-like metal-dependent hydrolase (beta-lactamase superfamily II)
MEELRPGLWFWKAAHPDWTPKDGGPTGWEQDVSSYAYDAGSTLVLFDPQSPPQLVDELASGKEVAVVLTCRWHARSAEELRERLGASIWSPGGDGELPDGVQAFDGGEDGEAVLWVEEHGAVVTGDGLIVREELEVPATWVPKGMTLEQFKQRLRPLLELPVEAVLVTHGDPVRENGGEELRRALVQSSS